MVDGIDSIARLKKIEQTQSVALYGCALNKDTLQVMGFSHAGVQTVR